MPFGSEGLQDIVGLALSGGGFRATLFHLGSVWRLNELGYLPKVDRISSVSGGSITSGVLALNWSKLTFVNDEATNFTVQIVNPLRDFCSKNIDLPAIGEGALLPWKNVSEVIEADYRKHLFRDTTLQQLPDRPRFIFNSTNVMTGVDFRFSKPYAGDYRVGQIKSPTFSLALAVTASSAFPPFLSPVVRTLDPTLFIQWDTEKADLFDQIEYKQRLMLTDGGVYDNLGLETVEKRCKTLLVSDAGAPFRPDQDPSTHWIQQAMRAFNVATNQSRGLRKRDLIDAYKAKVHLGAYWGITTLIGDYQLADALNISLESTTYLASIRTRLNVFSDAEQSRLINGGYALCDAAMRKYALTERPPQKAPQWPYPDYSLDRPIPAEQKDTSAAATIEAP